MPELHHRQYPYPAECVYLVTGGVANGEPLTMDALSAKVVVGRSADAVKKERDELHDDRPGMKAMYGVPLTVYQKFAQDISEAEAHPERAEKIRSTNPRYEADRRPWLVLLGGWSSGVAESSATRVVFANDVGDIERWAQDQNIILNSGAAADMAVRHGWPWDGVEIQGNPAWLHAAARAFLEAGFTLDPSLRALEDAVREEWEGEGEPSDGGSVPAPPGSHPRGAEAQAPQSGWPHHARPTVARACITAPPPSGPSAKLPVHVIVMRTRVAAGLS